MYWHESGMNGGGYVLMIVGMIIFLVLLGAGVAVLIHQSRRTTERTPAGASPEELLGQRFARGEIDEDEFNDRRRVLRQPVQTS